MMTKTPADQKEVDSIVAEMITQTIDVLDASKESQQLFLTEFETCSDLLESGDSAEAMRKLNDVLPGLQDFAIFCRHVLELADCLLPEEYINELQELCNNFQELLAALLKETENKDYVEVADILRYDLSDNLNKFFPLFSSLKTEFNKCLLQGRENNTEL